MTFRCLATPFLSGFTGAGVDTGGPLSLSLPGAVASRCFRFSFPTADAREGDDKKGEGDTVGEEEELEEEGATK